MYIRYALVVLAVQLFWMASTTPSSAVDNHFYVKVVSDNKMHIVAQVVLKRADGVSILDAKTPLTAATISNYSVEHGRIEESKKKLEKLGFTISSQDQFTLSITGSADLFSIVFGIEKSQISSSISDIHAATIPSELRDYIADVFIPKPPEFFP